MLPAVDFWNWGRTLINDFDKVLIFSAKAGPSFGKSTCIKSCAAHQPFPYSALTSLTAVLVPPCTKEKKSSERLWEILVAEKYTNTVPQKRRNLLKDCEKYWTAKYKNTVAQKRRNLLKDCEKYWWRQNTSAQKQQQSFPAFKRLSAHTE